MTCEICGSERFVDAHHYDCKEGRVSPETILLCRRCHRTYHDRGIEWFDDDKMDKAIEIENKRRKLVGAPGLLRREDIHRSPYWNKIHGIRTRKQLPRKKVDQMRLD